MKNDQVRNLNYFDLPSKGDYAVCYSGYHEVVVCRMRRAQQMQIVYGNIKNKESAIQIGKDLARQNGYELVDDTEYFDNSDMFSSLSQLKSQLFDAPADIKSDFNNIVKYFDPDKTRIDLNGFKINPNKWYILAMYIDKDHYDVNIGFTWQGIKGDDVLNIKSGKSKRFNDYYRVVVKDEFNTELECSKQNAHNYVNTINPNY